MLDKYKIDYAIDRIVWYKVLGQPHQGDVNTVWDLDYIIIKWRVPEYEQVFLWAATRKIWDIGEGRSRQVPRASNRDESGVIEVNRASRGSELDLKINQIPFEKWEGAKITQKRGKHVLDVAIKSVDVMHPVLGIGNSRAAIDGKSVVPVRLAINSEHILHELYKITNQGFDAWLTSWTTTWSMTLTYGERLLMVQHVRLHSKIAGISSTLAISCSPPNRAKSITSFTLQVDGPYRRCLEDLRRDLWWRTSKFIAFTEIST